MMPGSNAPLFAAAVLAVAVAAACSPPPETPPIDDPPEPQAAALQDAIQAPIDRARAVGDTLEQAAAAQAERIEHASE